ncbi:MAG: hypothetical protein HY738_22055 [Bacteroidia bacterium]|nr:hypothetical protein [Bacteroidia bacterium]
MIKSHFTFSVRAKNIKSFFVKIDNIPVPFFVKKNGLKIIGKSTVSLIFDNISNEKNAKELIDCDVYLPNKLKSLFNFSKVEVSENIIGFTIFDSKIGNIGIIEQLLYFPNNPVIQVVKNEKEILIPFTENLISKINVRKKIIEIICPDGLLELYK